MEKKFRPSAGFELSEKFDLTENVSLHEKIRYLTYLRFDLTENLLYSCKNLPFKAEAHYIRIRIQAF